MYYPFCVLLDSIWYYFDKMFYVHEKYWSVIFLQCLVRFLVTELYLLLGIIWEVFLFLLFSERVSVKLALFFLSIIVHQWNLWLEFSLWEVLIYKLNFFNRYWPVQIFYLLRVGLGKFFKKQFVPFIFVVKFVSKILFMIIFSILLISVVISSFIPDVDNLCFLFIFSLSFQRTNFGFCWFSVICYLFHWFPLFITFFPLFCLLFVLFFF